MASLFNTRIDRFFFFNSGYGHMYQHPPPPPQPPPNKKASLNEWLFTIYKGKPVGPRFRLFDLICEAKLNTGKFRLGIAFAQISWLPFNEKRPRKPKTCIKHGFSSLEHEFPIGTFRPEKAGLPFPGNVTPETTRKIRVPFTVFTFQTDFLGTSGCLSLARAKRSVDGLDKWFAKFGTGKFRPGIAFTICTNQFHLRENGFEEMEHGKTGLPFQMFRCSRTFPVGKTQKVVFHLLYFPTGFPSKQPVYVFPNFWFLKFKPNERLHRRTKKENVHKKRFTKACFKKITIYFFLCIL